MERTLPSIHELFKGARSPSDGEDCQLPGRVAAASIVTSTNRYNPPTVPRPAQKNVIPSPFEHSSVRKASRFEEPEVLDTRRRVFLLSSEDQATHEPLHHDNWSSADSALRTSGENKRNRTGEDLEDTSPIGEKRKCVSRYHVSSTGRSNLTKTGSSASTKALRTKTSVRCTSSRHPTLETDNSDVDQGVQHKVEEGKVAHKRAEQKRRNEHSSLIKELEHCVPSEYLDGCQPRNQKPGHTKNGTLKAMLKYNKHQATVIEEQDKIIEAQAAANAALREINAALMQQSQQYGSWNNPPG